MCVCVYVRVRVRVRVRVCACMNLYNINFESIWSLKTIVILLDNIVLD